MCLTRAPTACIPSQPAASCPFGITSILDGRSRTSLRNSANIAICRQDWCKSHRRPAAFWYRWTTRTTLVTATMRPTCTTITLVRLLRRRLVRPAVAAASVRGMVRRRLERERVVVPETRRQRTWSRVWCWYRRHQLGSEDQPRISLRITSTDCQWVVVVTDFYYFINYLYLIDI